MLSAGPRGGGHHGSSDSLKQDLGRRDFTVNAMSVSLSEDDWGTLTDYFGGRADLRDGILKTLHNLSFVEDPSRILRGVRLEQRLGMRFEDNTMRLLQNAVRGGLLECLSNQRIRTELEIDAKEVCFREIVTRMQELGVWDSLFPGIRFGEGLKRRLLVMERLLAWAARLGADFKGMEWLVGMAVLLSDSPANVRFAVMDRISLSPVERRELTQCFEAWPQVERFCSAKRAPTNSEAYLFFKEYGPAPLAYWMTCMRSARTRRLIIKHVLSWTPLRGELTGRDLGGMGLKGPEIGQMLLEIRLARMDGKITSREEEIAWVSARAARKEEAGARTAP